MNNLVLILTLINIKGVGNVTVRKFLEFIEDKNIENPTHLQIIDCFQELTKKDRRIPILTINDLSTGEEKAFEIIENSSKNNIQILCFGDSNYPYQLYDLHDAPMVLYYKGNIQALDNPTVAFVGTREPSNYGIKLGTRLAEVLIENKITILSGLALGCDSIGHQISIDENKPTIAILGGALHSIYPIQNTDLAHEILENNGLLLSEFPYGQNPTQYTFVQRDRLQSALSDATIIVQTGMRGGTLKTAKFTIQQSRILACLSTTNLVELRHEKFKGNQDLIRKGAIRIHNKENLDNLIFRVKKSHELKDKLHQQLLELF